MASLPAPEGGFDRARLAALTAAITSVTAVGIGLSLSVPLLSLEMERMGVSGTMVGLNTAIAGIAGIVVVPFVPRWAARFGVLTLLWASILIAGLSLVGFKLLYSLTWWFPLRFVFSAALSALFVLSEYWINSAAPPARRGLVMGVYASMLALGFASGPLILGVVGTGGWPPYLWGAALFLAATIPLLFAGGLSPDLGEKRGRPVRSFLFTAPAATMAAFIFGAVETGGFAIAPLYGLRIGFTPESAALLVSAVALGNVAFQIPLGWLSDRVDRRKLLLGCALVGMAFALLLPFVTHSWTALHFVLFLWGGVAGALYTVGLAHLGARFSGADLASANAAFVVLYNVGLITGPPVVGGFMDLFPPHGFAWSLALFFAAYAAVVAARLASRRSVP